MWHSNSWTWDLSCDQLQWIYRCATILTVTCKKITERKCSTWAPATPVTMVTEARKWKSAIATFNWLTWSWSDLVYSCRLAEDERLFPCGVSWMSCSRRRHCLCTAAASHLCRTLTMNEVLPQTLIQQCKGARMSYVPYLKKQEVTPLLCLLTTEQDGCQYVCDTAALFWLGHLDVCSVMWKALIY